MCLTYLNFDDFNQSGFNSRASFLERSEEYHFRRCAVKDWLDLIEDCSSNKEIFPLLQTLFSPSKPNTFITWMYDLVYHFARDEKDRGGTTIDIVCAETNPLHWAALCGLKAVAEGLIASGCDINRNSLIGAPLHCALFGIESLYIYQRNVFSTDVWRSTDIIGDLLKAGPDLDSWRSTDIISDLLEAGADPNSWVEIGTRKVTTLLLALRLGSLNTVKRMIDKGGVFDDRCLDLLDANLKSESIREIINHATNFSVQSTDRGRLFQLASKIGTANLARLIQENTDLSHQKDQCEEMLRTAASFGQIEVVRVLIEDQKLDVNVTDKITGKTALHHAAGTDQLGVVQVLIDHGADLNKMDRQGRTAIHHSVQGKDVRCLEFFVHRDVDTSFRDAEGMTVWHHAAQEANVRALKVLLKGPIISVSTIGLKHYDERTHLLCASARDVDIVPSGGHCLTDTASDGSSLLHYAARSGSLEVVKFLLERMVDPLAVTHDGSSAIHKAIQSKSQELANIVRLLIERGADSNRPRNDGCTPLDDLVREIREDTGSSSQIDCLFATGVMLSKSLLGHSKLASNTRSASELMYWACSLDFSGADETVSDLIKLGLDVNTRSVDDKTALIAAAINGDTKKLDELLIAGADPSIGTEFGFNALHYACFNDQTHIIARLRKTTIDWNSKVTASLLGDHCEMVTVLHIAATRNYGEVLEYLLCESLVMDIDACTKQGETPLILAVRARSLRNVSLLLSNKADSTVIDINGNSAVHWAAWLGLEYVVNEFIKYGSDLGLSSTYGLTPELLAKKNGHNELAKVIRDYVTAKSE